MYILLGLLTIIICGLFLGYIWLEFIEVNIEEPQAKRKWSDPKFKQDDRADD